MWRTTSFALALTFVSTVASAQQPCTTDARRVVDEVYRHMLERGADGGSQHWQTQLANGQMTVRDLVREVAKSPEHNQRFIRQENGEEMPFIRSVNTLYRHILGRQPDAEGARANARSVASNGIGPVIDAIVNSNEYTQQYGDWGVPGSGGTSFCAPGNRPANNNPAPAAPVARPSDSRFEGMDRNNDGSISRQEWEGGVALFRAHDANNDGRLSAEEVQHAEEADVDGSDRFENLDANDNGRIELREWQATDASFRRLDRNGDNYLSRAELAGQGGGAVATTGPGASNLIYVDADQRWTDTGIDVRAGQIVAVNAQGNIELSERGNDSATPAGAARGRRIAQAPVREAPVGGLIGRIGNGPAAFLGANGTMRAQTSGRLFLSVNDDYLDDNSGEYRVNVTVRGR